jgi:preprotein translocase subunit SecF
VRNFAFAMNIAAVIGTYSSLFIAAPLALWIHTTFYEKRGAGPERASRTATREDESEGGGEGEGQV